MPDLCLASMFDTNHEKIKELYFRTGKPSYLHVNLDPYGDLKWEFLFEDLGMCHSITSHAHVSLCPNPTPGFNVDGKIYPSFDQALTAIFGGHYTNFLIDFYSEMGISNQLYPGC
jgi:hypothetical protein